MIRNIILSGEKFQYELTKKRVKNINIRVDINGKISVSCPRYTTVDEVEKTILSFESFIKKSIKKQEQRKNESLEDVNYIDGDKIKIFDRERTLCVLPGRHNIAFLNDDKINLLCTDLDDKILKEKTVNRMLDRLAKDEIEKQINSIYPLFKDIIPIFPKISYKRTISQWGSCSKSKNHLSFNLHLISYPKECIRYVVIHEFTHYVHFDHSKEFYSDVERLMPDYKVWQKILRRAVIVNK